MFLSYFKKDFIFLDFCFKYVGEYLILKKSPLTSRKVWFLEIPKRWASVYFHFYNMIVLN